jgi:hypothetical protein
MIINGLSLFETLKSHPLFRHVSTNQIHQDYLVWTDDDIKNERVKEKISWRLICAEKHKQFICWRKLSNPFVQLCQDYRRLNKDEK